MGRAIGETNIETPAESILPRFLAAIADDAVLPPYVKPANAAIVVVHALLERLTAGQAHALVASLPSDVRELLEPASLEREGRPSWHGGRPELLDRVGKELGVAPASAELVASAVFRAVQQLLEPEMITHAARQLPHDLRELWLSPVAGATEDVTGDLDLLRQILDDIERSGVLSVRLTAREAFSSVMCIFAQRLSGGDARDRIRLAAPVDPADLEHRVETEDRLTREPSGRMTLKRLRRIGAIVVDEKEMGRPDRATITAALRAEADRDGLGALRWGERGAALRARLAFLAGLDEGWPDVSDAGLFAARETWLWPLLNDVQSLDAIADAALEQGLRALIPWDRQCALDELAPARLQTSLGSAAIDYAAEGGPRVDIRVQELFGVTTHPTVGGGRVPLTLALLSPARRPIQMTKDLPGFWAGSWREVRAEMRGRYPKHPWPEDPAKAEATSRAKPRGA